MSVPPPWTGMTFTSKLHSTPPPSLMPSNQSLPVPFVVAIIGASRNIGAATAKAFVQAGATGIILTATHGSAALHQTKAEVEAAASFSELNVTIIAADVGDTSSAKPIADMIASTFGRLDLLVNNAAILSTNESAFNKLGAIDISQIQKTMEVNFIGKFNVIQTLLPLLLNTERGAKTIVNMTSAMSHFASPGSIGYDISELATNRLTEAVAEAYGAEGVLAYAVHPGIVATMPLPIGMAPEARTMAVDDLGLCGAFLVWLVKEKREWLSGRYMSANWDVEELESKKDAIVNGDQLKMRLVV
ncbi:Short chain dehydrogenase citE [Lachnellula suecica]|uniref:Short chain dehydrogenase citE n=1 Tax=Lachnellula suecica TaxID=602035 RepID=A0A8T9C773_9HELO|nr:Short chain dehydrogenase citE [Lachnellula suecica]